MTDRTTPDSPGQPAIAIQHPAFAEGVDHTRRTYLLALQRQASIYGGTVAPATVAERRRRNTAARRARRLNRSR